MKTRELVAKKRYVPRNASDLSTETSAMIRMVLTAVHETFWPHVFFQRAAEDFTPEPVLRSVVTFCLANNLCASQEIELTCVDDPGLRYLAAGYRPNWQTIHEFRRRNAEPLKQSVSLVLRAAALCGSPNYGKLASESFEFPDCLSEANRRLIRAIQADSMAMDW